MMLPDVNSLRDAAIKVIQNSKENKYDANRFTSIVYGAKDDRELLSNIRKLLFNPEAITRMYTEVRKKPKLIMIEDFIVIHGEQWGFDLDAINKAKDNVELYNSVRKRY